MYFGTRNKNNNFKRFLKTNLFYLNSLKMFFLLPNISSYINIFWIFIIFHVRFNVILRRFFQVISFDCSFRILCDRSTFLTIPLNDLLKLTSLLIYVCKYISKQKSNRMTRFGFYYTRSIEIIRNIIFVKLIVYKTIFTIRFRRITSRERRIGSMVV